MKNSLFTLLFLGAMAMSSCSGSKSTLLSLLAGKSFTVESILGQALNAGDFMKGLPSFNFGADGKLTGNSGCNNFNGNFKLDGSNLSIDPGAMTRMACPGDGESKFLNALKQVNSLKAVGKSLKLMNGATELMSLVPKL